MASIDLEQHAYDSRRPMYLERASSMLFQTLSNRLNHPLKRKEDQRFIYKRLDLLDHHYCSEVDRSLWESYLNIGLVQHRWPVGVHR